MNKLNLNKLILVLIIAQSVFVGLLQAQTKRACDITDVASINKILNTELNYDPSSSINKIGKFECRYGDAKKTGKYVSIGLLEAKIEYGYDVLKTEFETNQKDISTVDK